MYRGFVITAALFGALGVALGAFGAHGLQATLEANNRADTFETASRYHLIHAVALLGVAWLIWLHPGRLARWAGYLLVAGTVIFSGSLYMLAIANWSVMGAVAPVGGAALVAGWLCLALAAWRISTADEG
jgi:uncharacterized membrane protein YgdD (TMEM256/DUF423 family)